MGLRATQLLTGPGWQAEPQLAGAEGLYLC